MDGFEDLRRDNYHADASAKAAQQEASELSRGHFHVDAQAKAAEQEAIDALDVDDERDASVVARRQDHQPSRARAGAQGGRRQAEGRDLADHTVMRRTTPDASQGPSGGAVISKRSGIGTYLKRRVREERSGSKSYERQARRERKRWEREQRRASGEGLGARHVLLGALAVIVASPTDTPVTTPLASTLATEGAELSNVTSRTLVFAGR